MTSNAPIVGLIVPVFNEEACLDALFDRIEAIQKRLGHVTLDVLFVDDHSTDRSWPLIREACADARNWRGIRLSRNSGSHVAILAGLESCTGGCAIFLAADLQDPPELVHEMLEKWRSGKKVVWAAREEREGIPWYDHAFARLFYVLLNWMGDVRLPPQGSDFALLDRLAIDAVLKSTGASPSLSTDIARVGFDQETVYYVKGQRFAGKSKWTLRKKLSAFADAIVSTSYFPVRCMSYLGIVVSGLGFLYAGVIVAIRLFLSTKPIEGWASLMICILALGGFQMTMLGVLGEYLWRTLGEARRRPRYFIEDVSCPEFRDGKEREA